MKDDDSQRIQQYFDREAAEYTERSGGPLWKRLREAETRTLMELLDPKPGESVLDAGCGAGYYTKRLIDAGADVTALDFSEGMVEQVKKRYGVKAIQGDLASVSIASRFDKVLCAGALEFVSDPGAAVANMAAGLKDDGPGVLVLLVPARSLFARIYRFYHRRHGFSVNLFTRDDVKELAGGIHPDKIESTTFNYAVKLTRESNSSS